MALAVLLAPLPVAAGPGAPTGETPAVDPAVERAMAAYERGTQNYNLAQYEAALADFQEAATLYASPDFQYNIGLCYEKLGKNEEAIRAFATYLKAKPDAEDRPNVENRIRELQEELERQRKEAEEAAKKPDPVVIAPQPEPEPKDEPTATGNEGRGMIIVGAAMAGLGGAVALGGGVAFGVLAGQDSAELEEIQSGGNPQELTFTAAEELEKSGKRLESIQIAMVASGSVIAVGGAVLLALGVRKRKAARALPQAFIGPGVAGLSLTGRF